MSDQQSPNTSRPGRLERRWINRLRYWASGRWPRSVVEERLWLSDMWSLRSELAARGAEHYDPTTKPTAG